MNENQIQLKVQKRETGKQQSKKHRREGMVPGVFYLKEVKKQDGGSEEWKNISIPIVTSPLALRSVVYTSEMKIVDLFIEGEDKPRECILKDVDFDPITDQITHFDMLGIRRGFKMTFEIPIILKGTPAGVKDGGVIQHSLHKVLVECMPKDLPNVIEVDISHLNIGNSIYLKEIELENVEILASSESVIVSVVPPRIVKTAAEEAAEAAEAEAAEAAAEAEEAEDEE